MNNLTIDASEYHRIGDSDLFYYENRTTNDTFSIAVLDPTVTFSVCCFLTVQARLLVILQVISYTYGHFLGSGFPVSYSKNVWHH